MPSTWATLLEELNASPNPPGTQSFDLQSGPGTGELRAAEHLWSHLVFTSTPAPPFPLPPTTHIPPLATYPLSQAANLPPDPGFDWTTHFPAPSSAPLLPPLPHLASSATTSESPTNGDHSLRTHGSMLEEGEEEIGSPEEVEEKRQRNTAASGSVHPFSTYDPVLKKMLARFRAKKKERETRAEATSARLRARVVRLEKEATSLKSENKWLRELVGETAGMDPRLLAVLRVHPVVAKLAGR